MTDIDVQGSGDRSFRVTVSDDRGSSEHDVRVPEGYPEQLGVGDASLEDLVGASFEFLLQRESKESILGEFDLTVIAGYFPDYEKEMRMRMGTAS